MAKARILQWPLMWPLSRIEKARQTAQKIASFGELKVGGVEDWHVGYVLLLVVLPGKNIGWYVKIRPVHFGGYDAKVFDFSMLRYIEFEYYDRGIAERHSFDPSNYLTIKNVR